MTQNNAPEPVCGSTYVERGFTYRCTKRGEHEKHVGTSPGRVREWTDGRKRMPDQPSAPTGFITISRTESNVVDPYISITVRGEHSELRVEMTLADFAMAVTGLGRAPVTVNYEGEVRRG